MRLLVAREFVAGRWEKVGVVSATKDGARCTFPVCLQGQIGSQAARSAAKQFAAEKSAREVFFTFGSESFRVTRI